MTQRLRNIPQWIDLLWLSLLAIYVLAGTAIVPFHGDESTLIYMGRDYYYHFIEGDMSKIQYDETWTVSATEQHLRLLNGTIAKYSYGWIASNNGFSLDDINEQWDWGADYFYNLNTGHTPDEALLQQVRLASTLYLILSVIVLFLLTKMILNRPIAYLTTLYFVFNPIILLNGRRAMMEGSHFLGMMLILWAGLWVIQRRKWWQFIILGIVAGYAIASKHPNAIITALVFIAYFSIGLIEASRSQWQSLSKMISGLIIAGIFTLIVFYVLNPAWWEMPLESGQQALSLRSELLQVQAQAFDHYSTLSERISGFFNFVFIAQPQYYEDSRWATYTNISQQIHTYNQSIWSGASIVNSLLGGFVSLISTLFGVFHFARNTSIRADHRWVIMIWGVGICIVTFILTPLPWARYYLPVYPFVGLMTAYSVITLSNIFWKRFVQ